MRTARKYVDSPGPSRPDPGLYSAYGGPHALVSSPRTGCSILMTSALLSVNAGAGESVKRTCPPEIAQYLGAVRLEVVSRRTGLPFFVVEKHVRRPELWSYPKHGSPAREGHRCRSTRWTCTGNPICAAGTPRRRLGIYHRPTDGRRLPGGIASRNSKALPAQEVLENASGLGQEIRRPQRVQPHNSVRLRCRFTA